MSDPKPSATTDPAVQDLIRRMARQLSRRHPFRNQDISDLMQAISTGLLGRLAALDPSREHAVGFLVRLIDQVAANLLRECQAAKRDHRQVRSLNTPVGDGDQEGFEAADVVTQEDLARRTGGRTRSSQELTDLQADVAAVIQGLPPPLRDLAERLMRDTIADVARSTGTPQTTLRYRRQRLREVFESENLRDYL